MIVCVISTPPKMILAIIFQISINFTPPVNRLLRVFGYQPNPAELYRTGYALALAKFLYPPFGNTPFCRRFRARYDYRTAESND